MKALIIDKVGDGQQNRIADIDKNQLPKNDTLVKVSYSTLNYKDALAITGKGKIIRQYPLVPGIDLAGTIVETTHPNFKEGDAVILNGFGVGESHWGGLAEYASVKGDFLIPLPQGMLAKEAMSAGTAGYTAALCVRALEKSELSKMNLPVVVTGATGGVGSYSIQLLKQLGYEVAAVTGKSKQNDYLKNIGADVLLSRESFVEPARPLEKQKWCGGVDTLGGFALSRMLAETNEQGAVAACGLAMSHKLETTVMPFILRGVSLIGIDSVYAAQQARIEAWSMLAKLDTSAMKQEQAIQEITLDKVEQACQEIVNGNVTGRYLVKLSD